MADERKVCINCDHSNLYCTYCRAFERPIYPEYINFEGCEAWRRIIPPQKINTKNP